MTIPLREPRTMAELDALSPAERRAYWRRLRRRWQFDYLAELANDYARDAQDELENRQDYTTYTKDISI